jgi:AIG2-like family
MPGGVERVDVFFYGLFMDADLLRGRGASPQAVAPAYVDGFRLQLGERADLVSDAFHRTYGVLMNLTDAEVDRLYEDPTVRAYRPQIVTAHRIQDGGAVVARCYTLPEGTQPTPPNPAYLERLREIGRRAGLPTAYLDAL